MFRFALTLAVVGCSFCAPATSATPGPSTLILASKFEPPNDGAPGGRSDSGSHPRIPTALGSGHK